MTDEAQDQSNGKSSESTTYHTRDCLYDAITSHLSSCTTCSDSFNAAFLMLSHLRVSGGMVGGELVIPWKYGWWLRVNSVGGTLTFFLSQTSNTTESNANS